MQKDEKGVELLWHGKHMKPGPEQVNSPDCSSLLFHVMESVIEPPSHENQSPEHYPREWVNKLIWGDNRLVMSSLLKQGWKGKINLIYIDPPFYTGADFSYTTHFESEEYGKKSSSIEHKAYRDTWDGGIASYLRYMHERLLLMKDLLAESGSIYIHLDWRVIHYVKIICDEIFGYDNFVNEIIWKKTNSPKAQSKGFGTQHDTILIYSKSGDLRFKQPFREFDDGSLKPYSYDDHDGKGKYRLIEIEAQGVQKTPNRKQFTFRDRTAPYLYNIDTLKEWDSQGIIYRTAKGRYCKKQYLRDMKGVLVSDIWVDREASPIQSSEKIGYDTQKPEDLLRRIIETSTSEGDLVADFFCGSGTTPAVAEKLGRRWIGSDLSKYSIQTTKKRLLDIHLSKNLTSGKNEKYGKTARPFEIWKMENCETEYWRENQEKYLSFMIRLYNSNPVSGYDYIQASMESRAIHFGPVDAAVSMNIVRNFVSECVSGNFSGGDILGWKWDHEVSELAIRYAHERGIDLKLIQIPDVNEIKSAIADSTSHQELSVFPVQTIDEIRSIVHFHELSSVKISIRSNGNGIILELEDFQFPESFDASLLPGKVNDGRLLIDYWAVDWDYDGDIFHNQWRSYRTKKEVKLELEATHTYDDVGEHTILVKVVDVFGNETEKILKTAV